MLDHVENKSIKAGMNVEFITDWNIKVKFVILWCILGRSCKYDKMFCIIKNKYFIDLRTD